MTMKPHTAIVCRHRASLCGASLSALVLAIAATPVAAQSFQGTGTVNSGIASIVDGTGTTDVFIGSTEVVIDWTTNDPGGSGNVIFQTGGTTANFTDSGINGTDYTVLNRIVPVDGTGNPTSSTIQFDGTVNSTLAGGTGGNVWFYSPNGVIVGSTATFNVGGLVLTTNPIDTTGGLYGPTGQIRFAGAAGSLAPVTIQSGAQINALLNPQVPTNAAYVALVAPRIEQGGTVRSDGSIAYVAAEVADITINAGLFDINVTTGTTDANGVVHTGTTGGSASTSAADVKTAYMVAVGKNDGLTMLLNGGIGYDAAAVATDDGSSVVLSAGHGIGFDAGNPLVATGNIAIGDAQFTSVTTASATDTITVAPTTLTQFDRFTTLSAINLVQLDALGGAQIVANDTTGLPSDLLFPPFGIAYALDVNAGYADQGGAVAINVDGGGALTAAGRIRLRAIGDATSTTALTANGQGGSVAINLGAGSITAPNLEIDVSGYGQDIAAGIGGNGNGGSVTIVSAGTLAADDLNVSAYGRGGSGDTGGNGFGGTIQLTATGGGTVPATNFSLDASGDGGDGVNVGGNGTAGQIDVLVDTGGSLGSAASFYTYATSYGGYSDVQGGDGTGGAITITDNGGLLDFDNVGLYASGYGSGGSGNGGDGFGGTGLVSLSGNGQSWGSLYIEASAYGGESYGGGFSGNATADLVNGARVNVQGVALNLGFSLDVHADSYTAANTVSGGFANGGNALVSVGSGGSLTVGSDTSITANAGFQVESSAGPSIFSPDMTAGTAGLTIDNAAVTLPSLLVEAQAQTTGGQSGAGTATGGTATVSVANNGSLVVDSALGVFSPSLPGLNILAGAYGDYVDFFASPGADQYGAAAQGGTASLILNGGTIDVADPALVYAGAIGGIFTSVGGADSLGSGTGGTAQVAIGGGTMTLASTLDVSAEGIGGSVTGGAKGGNGTGGLAGVDVTGGALIVNGTGISVDASGSSLDVDPAANGSSGDGTGGQARLAGSGGTITVAGITQVTARGLAGAAGLGGVGGNSTGGLAVLSGSGGGIVTLNGLVSVLADAIGGDGSVAGALGGNAFGGSASAGQQGTGSMTVGTDLRVDGSATGGANSVDSLTQGLASGGSAGLASEGGTFDVVGNAVLTADASGGTNPGGTAPPTVAGFLKIGSSAATPSGALTVFGTFDATATGDTARADGQGLYLRTADAAISVVGETTFTTTGDAVFNILGTGSLDAGGALTITSTQGQITGTGLITSAGNMLIDGATGIDLGSLSSGGTTGLFSALGPVNIADLLSTGPVTVSGLSVSIGSSGGLTFADADATGGDLALAVTDDLVVATVDATGAVTLTSSNGAVSINGAVNGAGIAIGAGTDVTANANLTSGGTLDVAAGGTFSSTALVTATGNTAIVADAGISLPSLVSGGTTVLQSSAGPVAVTQLTSTGLVTALGQSIDIASTGALTFASADATAGNLSIQTAGDLTFGNGSATGTAQLTSTGGSIAITGLLSGTGVTLNGAQDVTFASLTSADALAITAGNAVTASGAIVSGGQASITSGTALSLQGLSSGASTLLQANGTLAVADLLSTGPVTASGTSLDIASSGSLAFADATATGGNLALRTQGNLDIVNASATGSVDLASTAGSFSNTGNVSGAGIAIAAGQDVTATGALNSSADLAVDAGANAAIAGNATATGLLAMSAGQTLTIDGFAVGGTMTATSQDIVIGPDAQVGQRGRTTSVTFTNSNGANLSSIGGAAAGSGYSLDNGELQQVFADSAISFSVQTGTGEVRVGDLALGFGPGLALGTGGTLSLTSNGRISVIGNVALTTSGALDTLALAAPRVEVATDLGAIAMTNANGGALGLLRVTADRFTAATSGAIGQIDTAPDITAIDGLMGQPAAGSGGGLLAGAIEASVTDGIFIQNLGATTAFADRRGFTANALSITTAGTGTRIVVNGVLIDSAGNALTGLDTVTLVTVNGNAAAAGGPFNPLSTVNGCVIGLTCTLLQTDNGLESIIRTKTDIEYPVTPENNVGALLSPPPIQINVDLPELVRNLTLPLVDEPVTGVGNEDLWGDSCSPDTEGCVGGQSK
ncbi:hypothetical protein [Novosphingobium sp. PP1Y]|uniref:hypothetical protein n=1 Tax=Novosphingobium sp. PP1Y TaxID=702113 RepID=UPI0011D1A5FD|nr:hypothetical protein [Novosphingobium sp. PP1Y]